jgi:REP-associated tyrosine transposase
MPRLPRPQLPDGIYHVTSRGVRGSSIFVEGDDRRRFVRLLAETVAGCEWQCLAYCLMTNHYHLVVATPTPTISVGMHGLNGRYARWFNRRHGHVGHLFENRFHSELIESDRHLLEACRYVVLNPVRAGIVSEPADWAWSSYRQALSPRAPDTGPDVRALLEYFSERDPAAARRRLEKFVAEGNGHGPRRHGQVPGTRAWPG